MSKPINPVRKLLMKKNIKAGISLKQSALNSGYSPATAINAWRLTVVKEVLKDIEAEFKLKDITAENVLKRLDTIGTMAMDSNDLSVATQVELAKGKFIGIWEGQHTRTSNLSTEGARIIEKATQLWVEDETVCNNATDIGLQQSVPIDLSTDTNICSTEQGSNNT